MINFIFLFFASSSMAFQQQQCVYMMIFFSISMYCSVNLEKSLIFVHVNVCFVLFCCISLFSLLLYVWDVIGKEASLHYARKGCVYVWDFGCINSKSTIRIQAEKKMKTENLMIKRNQSNSLYRCPSCVKHNLFCDGFVSRFIFKNRFSDLSMRFQAFYLGKWTHTYAMPNCVTSVEMFWEVHLLQREIISKIMLKSKEFSTRAASNLTEKCIYIFKYGFRCLYLIFPYHSSPFLINYAYFEFIN